MADEFMSAKNSQSIHVHDYQMNKSNMVLYQQKYNLLGKAPNTNLTELFVEARLILDRKYKLTNLHACSSYDRPFRPIDNSQHRSS